MRIMRLHRHDSIFPSRFQAPVRRSGEAPTSQGLAAEDHRSVRAGGYGGSRRVRFDYRIDALSAEQLTDDFAELLQTHSWASVKLELYGLKFFHEHAGGAGSPFS